MEPKQPKDAPSSAGARDTNSVDATRPHADPSFLRSLWNSFIEDQKDALRIALAGVTIGALAGIGSGVYLFQTFGLIGVGVLLVLGAIIGGIGLWLMYQLA